MELLARKKGPDKLKAIVSSDAGGGNPMGNWGKKRGKWTNLALSSALSVREKVARPHGREAKKEKGG